MRGFDLTQAELAERIGISQNYLSTMETRQGGSPVFQREFLGCV
jgi:transcriptional regulator with XRE-family HTH domain